MGLKQKLRAARQWLTVQFLIFTCWQIIFWLPRRRWYWGALAVSRFLVRCGGRLAPLPPNVTRDSLVARLLHRILDLLFTRRPHFPIPLIVEGRDVLEAYAAEPGGFVCCSAHIPLVKLFLPFVREVVGDQRDMRVIAREPVGINEVAAWNDASWPAIRTDHAALVHVRSLLRRHGVLMIAVDREQGEAISSNIFRFVGKVGSRALMWFTQLQPDGAILLRILLPPGPRCRNDEEIRANLDFVARNVQRILQGETILPAAKLRPTILHTDDEARSRDLQRIHMYSDAQLRTRIRRLEALLAGDSDSPEQQVHPAQRLRLEQRLALMRAESDARVSA